MHREPFNTPSLDAFSELLDARPLLVVELQLARSSHDDARKLSWDDRYADRLHPDLGDRFVIVDKVEEENYW